MKFLNLNTGYSFDALWKEDSTKGYIFWFDGEQSTNIIYTKTIAFIVDNDNEIQISIEENDIFKLIDETQNNNVISIDDVDFIDNDKLFVNTINITPQKIKESQYVAIFNVIGNSKVAGEYLCKINVGDKGYIRVGADFYGEHEPVYINLANMGVEIPESIQKTIYSTNVHEDNKDNIIINRKFKELISNYWDIVANRGSYKSLINSLEWFEWKDKLTIKEINKNIVAGLSYFNDKDIKTIIDNKIIEDSTNFAKTTYFSLYCLAYNEVPNEYDIEKNPILKDVIFKWTKNDIRLKLSLMSQFFGEFFLPIHTSLLHTTLEDTVFTNTIKTILGATSCRNDFVGDTTHVKCNINGNTFKLSNVYAQTTDSTVFSSKIENVSFGVDIFPKNDKISDYTQFSNQLYIGPGVIVPIELIIEKQSNKDFIKHTTVTFEVFDRYETLDFYDRFDVINNTIKINFNFLAKEAKEYTLLFTFYTASSKTITKKVSFTVEDVDNVNINVYKILSKDDSNGFSNDDFLNFNDDSTKKLNHIIKLQSNDKTNFDASKENYMLRLSYMTPDNLLYNCKCYSYNGIKLNRTIVINVSGLDYSFINDIIDIMKNDYLVYSKYEVDENTPVSNDITYNAITYLVFISKKFYGETPKELEENYNEFIIRNNLGFYPQFHYLEILDGNSIEDYTISQYDALCAVVEINVSSNIQKPLKYTHFINDYEWKFVNSSRNKEVIYPKSSRTPFVANTTKNLTPGYYDISFKCSLSNGITKEFNAKS